jgi:periplasmic protein TonB
MWTFVSREAEASPFALCQERSGRRWASALSISLAAHLIVLLVYCWPTAPVFVNPNLLARGEGGSSAPEAVTLYLPQDVRAVTTAEPKLALPSVHQPSVSKAKPRQRHNVLAEEKPDNREIGSTLGSSAEGPAYGDEVKPALPVAFPDPQISRHELPSGLQGDVVIEITIDVQGNVVETRLLQGVGHGIDEKVIAAAREWHFRPATRNGIAVPSKQDYRFHVPS